MKILSVDTSSNICAVAILEDKTLIKEISLDNGLTHSQNLMPIIEKLFLETNLNLADIDLLVCDKGPGSFTGIRIGTSTVMAFADSLQIETIGISSLEALSYNVKQDGIICSLIDAKNSNCYYGIYKLENGDYSLLHDLFSEHIDNIIEILKDYNAPITFVGSGAIANLSKIKEAFANCIFEENHNLSAYNLGLTGLTNYKNGNIQDVLPLYLRKSQAERMKEEKDNASANK